MYNGFVCGLNFQTPALRFEEKAIYIIITGCPLALKFFRGKDYITIKAAGMFQFYFNKKKRPAVEGWQTQASLILPNLIEIMILACDNNTIVHCNVNSICSI